MSALSASPAASPTERDELVGGGPAASAPAAPQGGAAQRALRVLAAVESKVWTLVLTPLVLSPLLLSGGSSAFPARAERTLGATIMMASLVLKSMALGAPGGPSMALSLVVAAAQSCRCWSTPFAATGKPARLP